MSVLFPQPICIAKTISKYKSGQNKPSNSNSWLLAKKASPAPSGPWPPFLPPASGVLPPHSLLTCHLPQTPFCVQSHQTHSCLSAFALASSPAGKPFAHTLEALIPRYHSGLHSDVALPQRLCPSCPDCLTCRPVLLHSIFPLSTQDVLSPSGCIYLSLVIPLSPLTGHHCVLPLSCISPLGTPPRHQLMRGHPLPQ